MPGITPVPRVQPAAAVLNSKVRARPTHRESTEQRMFVQRFRLDPRTRDLPACAIPNAGRRSKLTGGILKAEGMSKGAPDWLCFEPSSEVVNADTRNPAAIRPRYVGLAFEFKDPEVRRKPTPEQLEWHRKLRERGWQVLVVHTSIEAWQLLCEYLNLKPNG